LESIWGGQSFDSPYIGPTGWQRSETTTYFANSDDSLRAYNAYGRPTDVAPWQITKAQTFNNLGIPDVDLNYTASIGYGGFDQVIWQAIGVQRSSYQITKAWNAVEGFAA